MSTALIVGVIIILLVVGVPLLQALLRGISRRRSLSLDGVGSLRSAGLRGDELPAGLSAQGALAVTSEALALESEVPEATIVQLDDSGRVVGYREVFRDPRSWGEFVDWMLANSLHRGRAHRRVEVELTRYASAGQAAAAVSEGPPLDLGDDDVSIAEAGERDGLLAREWTRLESGDVVQRMLELRWASGDVLGVVRGDSEPSGALADDEVRRLAGLVRGRLP